MYYCTDRQAEVLFRKLRLLFLRARKKSVSFRKRLMMSLNSNEIPLPKRRTSTAHNLLPGIAAATKTQKQNHHINSYPIILNISDQYFTFTWKCALRLHKQRTTIASSSQQRFQNAQQRRLRRRLILLLEMPCHIHSTTRVTDRVLIRVLLQEKLLAQKAFCNIYTSGGWKRFNSKKKMK